MDTARATMERIKDDPVEFFVFGGAEETESATAVVDELFQPESTIQCSSASVHANQGPRNYMEDTYFISKDGVFFGVFDGHGGSGVSNFLQEATYDFLVRNIASQGSFLGHSSKSLYGKDIPSAATTAFAELQGIIAAEPKYDYEGSTAVCVLLDNDKIWSVNVGDSRAVLCRGGQAVDLTEDHKPNSDTERARIIALGGVVEWFGWQDADGRPVESMGSWRVNGNLGLSRAMGDRLEAPCISAEPDVRCKYRVASEDQFIILASDGLWDVFSSQEAVDFVKEALTSNIKSSEYGDATAMTNAFDKRHSRMGRLLVEEALRRGTLDNTTAIVVWL